MYVCMYVGSKMHAVISGCKEISILLCCGSTDISLLDDIDYSSLSKK